MIWHQVLHALAAYLPPQTLGRVSQVSKESCEITSYYLAMMVKTREKWIGRVAMQLIATYGRAGKGATCNKWMEDLRGDDCHCWDDNYSDVYKEDAQSKILAAANDAAGHGLPLVVNTLRLVSQRIVVSQRLISQRSMSDDSASDSSSDESAGDDSASDSSSDESSDDSDGDSTDHTSITTSYNRIVIGRCNFRLPYKLGPRTAEKINLHCGEFVKDYFSIQSHLIYQCILFVTKRADFEWIVMYRDAYSRHISTTIQVSKDALIPTGDAEASYYHILSLPNIGQRALTARWLSFTFGGRASVPENCIFFHSMVVLQHPIVSPELIKVYV